MVVGFGLDLPRFFHQQPFAPSIVHIHAVVFSGWMVLLTAQVLLVVRDRVAWHRRLGWFAAGYACLMAILGPVAGLSSEASRWHTQASDPGFLIVNFVDIGGFLVLLAWGLALRRNPAAHRRMMMLATVSLADPGFGRITQYFLTANTMLTFFLALYYGNLLLIFLMTLWDWRRGRLMRPFVLGAAGLVAAEFAATCLYGWTPWVTLAGKWVAGWARLTG